MNKFKNILIVFRKTHTQTIGPGLESCLNEKFGFSIPPPTQVGNEADKILIFFEEDIEDNLISRTFAIPEGKIIGALRANLEGYTTCMIDYLMINEGMLSKCLSNFRDYCITTIFWWEYLVRQTCDIELTCYKISWNLAVSDEIINEIVKIGLISADGGHIFTTDEVMNARRRMYALPT